jgi:HPt (histidine-containing phosphotransfer) domain-containing protein
VHARDPLTARRPPRDEAGERILDPLRVAELSALFDGDELPAMWRELVANVSGDLERVSAAEARGDAAAVAAAAHSIAGTAMMIGAKRLIGVVEELERRGREAAAGEPVDRDAIEALRRHWASTRAAIDAHIAALER